MENGIYVIQDPELHVWAATFLWYYFNQAHQPFAEDVYSFDCPNGVSVEAYLKQEFPYYEDMNCILIDNAVNEYGNTHDRRFNTIQLKTIKTHKPIYYKEPEYPMKPSNIPLDSFKTIK